MLHLPRKLIQDKRLFQAARLGDVFALNSMLKDNRLILERVALIPIAETPLHIATLAGKADFVKAVVSLKPSFAWDLNQDGFSPLHIASALGHAEIVRVLLTLSPDLRLLKDHEGRIPLHYAAIKGRVGIIEELLLPCSEALKVAAAQGDTAFHLAVKNKQLEAVRVLVEKLGNNKEVINATNDDGLTIFQLAKATNQLLVLDLLDGNDKKLVRFEAAENEGNFSVKRSESGGGNQQVIQIVPEEQRTGVTEKIFQVREAKRGVLSSALKKLKIYVQNALDLLATILTNDENTLVVAATLIATVTYQAALQPPATIWKENMKMDYKCKIHEVSFLSQPNHCPSIAFLFYMFFNRAGFSCSVMLLLLFRTGTHARILIATSLTSLFCSYITLLIAMSPDTISFVIIFILACLELLITYFVACHWDNIQCAKTSNQEPGSNTTQATSSHSAKNSSLPE